MADWKSWDACSLLCVDTWATFQSEMHTERHQAMFLCYSVFAAAVKLVKTEISEVSVTTQFESIRGYFSLEHFSDLNSIYLFVVYC